MMIRHGGGPRGGVARSVKRMRGYLAELIHRKRERATDERRGDDLISGLIRASDHGEHLTENEAAAMAFILLFAGFETTVNLIGNGMYALLRHPGAARRGCRRRSPAATSATAGDGGRGTAALRRPGGAGDLAVRHRAARPSAGSGIAAGEPVLVVLAAADRDPARFADPDTLDLARARQPAPRVRPRHPLLPRRAAGPAGGRRTALATLLPACRTCDSRWTRPNCAGAAGSSCVDCARCP